MRKVLIWVLVGGWLALCGSAMATVSGGISAALLAVGGAKQRYAIIQYASIQEDCPGAACELFVIDTMASKFAPKHRKTITKVDGKRTPLDHYLSLLPKDVRKRLTPLTTPDSLPKLAVDQKRSTTTKIVFALNAREGLRVELKNLWTVASMGFAGSYQHCIDDQKNVAACSSCRRVTRWVDGKPMKTWACQGKGWMTQDGKRRRCDCAARAPMKTVRLSRTSNGATVLGSKMLVEPHLLAQDFIEERNARPPSAIALDLGWADQEGPNTVTPDMQAYLLGGAVLVVGDAAFARNANSTYFPLVASFPRWGLGTVKAAKASP